MSTSESTSGYIYRTMQELTNQYGLEAIVPLEVRIFSADIVAEVVVLSDTALIMASREFDQKWEFQPDTYEISMHRMLDSFKAQAHRVYGPEASIAESWALRRLRMSFASARFRREFAESFPGLSDADAYKLTELFRRGDLLTYEVTMRYLLAHPND